MATSYTNLGGSGGRLGVVIARTDLTVNNIGQMQSMVDAYTNTNFYFSPSTQAIAGKSIEFEFRGSPRVVDAFKIFVFTNSGAQSWKFQGWDGSTWVDLTTFNWPTVSGGVETTFTNTTAYQKYRFLGVSGTIGSSNYPEEIQFKTDSYSPFEAGDRSAIITPTTNFSVYGGSIGKLIDGVSHGLGTSSECQLYTGAIAGKYFQFELNAPEILTGAYITTVYTDWLNNATRNIGTAKWQGSNDGSNWTDLTAESDWTLLNYTSNNNIDPGSTFWAFEGNTTAYTYYRMLCMSGTWPTSGYGVLEVMFDAGPVTLRNDALVTSDYVEVLNMGVESKARVTSMYVEVLSAVAPATDVTGFKTDVGIYDDITEFDNGGGPPDPLELSAALVDEGEIDATLNTNVGNPFVAKMRDETVISAMLTKALQASLYDEGRINAYAAGLIPPPVVQTMVVLTGH